MALFNQRERALDLLGNIENLINSIANHPKKFDADLAEIQIKKQGFKDVCDFAKEELSAAQKSAVGTGAGVAGGAELIPVFCGLFQLLLLCFGGFCGGMMKSRISGGELWLTLLSSLMLIAFGIIRLLF